MQFSIGVSALQASQRALDVTGHNIANANTPGYHRQVVQLASVTPLRLGQFSIGRGVAITDIQRIINDNIEAAQVRQAAATGGSESQLSFATQLESRLSNEQASPGARLETLFNQLEQLSSQLNSSSQRKLVIASAAAMTREFNSLANDVQRLREDVDQSISSVVAEINPLTKQIASLNSQIAQQTAQGISPNDLLDQRALAVQELSQRIGVEVQPGNQGQVTLLVGGIPLVVSGRALTLESFRDASDQIRVHPVGTDADLEINDGQLGGFLNARRELLPRYQARLDELASTVARAFNAVQTTGVGVAGAFTTLTSQQPVRDVTQPLNSAGSSSPLQAGRLIVAVTNVATGERTLTTLDINPATQSLNDIAGALADIPHMQSFANSVGGTLTVMAEPGFTFDFRGDGQTDADSSGILSTLGLNSFFTGNTAASLRVSDDLLADADRLATSRSGQPGDSTNLQRLVALRDAPLMPNQSTFSNDFTQTVADIGADVQGLTEQRDTNQLLADRLEEQRQSLSGVDPNEELVNLLKYQRMFQIASKYINVLNDAYDELLKIR